VTYLIVTVIYLFKGKLLRRYERIISHLFRYKFLIRYDKMVFDLFINKLFSQREMAFDHTTQHILQKVLALQPRCVPRWNAWRVFPKTVLKTFFFRRSLRAFRIRNTLLKRSRKKDNRPSVRTHKKCSKETKCPSIPLERGSLVSYPKKVWRLGMERWDYRSLIWGCVVSTGGQVEVLQAEVSVYTLVKQPTKI